MFLLRLCLAWRIAAKIAVDRVAKNGQSLALGVVRIVFEGRDRRSHCDADIARRVVRSRAVVVLILEIRSETKQASRDKRIKSIKRQIFEYVFHCYCPSFLCFLYFRRSRSSSADSRFTLRMRCTIVTTTEPAFASVKATKARMIINAKSDVKK